MDWSGKFFKGVFSEGDGSPSFARVATGVVISFVLGWDSAYMVLAWQWNAHHLVAGQAPIPMYPDPAMLAAQTTFIAAVYALNRLTADKQQ